MERISEEVGLLIAQTGPLNGQRWPLKMTTVIGREPDCDIVIPDRQVSRHHARLRLTPDGTYLEDLGSKNGTHHNGVLLTDNALLQDGDTIQIALAQKFVYLSSDATVPLEGLELASLLPNLEAPKEDQSLLEIRRLRLDKRSRRMWVRPSSGPQAGEEVEVLPPLSVSQFRLLEALYDIQGLVVPRQDLVAAVWREAEAFEVSEQALDALVRRLRDRIASIDPHHNYIVTVRGHGLRLDNPPLDID
jgi:pSer/pThr/pTyr-binding forkhead associated (FHA) protein